MAAVFVRIAVAVEVLVLRPRGGQGRRVAVALDVVSLVRVGVVLGINVARGSAPLAFEAPVVGPVVVIRVAIRGSRRALR